MVASKLRDFMNVGSDCKICITPGGPSLAEGPDGHARQVILPARQENWLRGEVKTLNPKKPADKAFIDAILRSNAFVGNGGADYIEITGEADIPKLRERKPGDNITHSGQKPVSQFVPKEEQEPGPEGDPGLGEEDAGLDEEDEALEE